MPNTAGSLAGKQIGSDDTLSGNNGDLIFGDAEMASPIMHAAVTTV